jgi:hypothetical protein
MSKQNNVSDEIRYIEYEKAKIIASHIIDELAKQKRYKTMKTRRNGSNYNIPKSTKKVYTSSPLKSRTRRRHN